VTYTISVATRKQGIKPTVPTLSQLNLVTRRHHHHTSFILLETLSFQPNKETKPPYQLSLESTTIAWLLFHSRSFHSNNETDPLPNVAWIKINSYYSLNLVTRVTTIRLPPSHLRPFHSKTRRNQPWIKIKSFNYLRQTESRDSLPPPDYFHLTRDFFSEWQGIETTIPSIAKIKLNRILDELYRDMWGIDCTNPYQAKLNSTLKTIKKCYCTILTKYDLLLHMYSIETA